MPGISFWNERYRQTESAYGKTPNLFFQSQLASLAPGKILLPAEGEGRNAVYAASQGWAVSAFDFSEAGKEKAIALAHEAGVTISYQVGEFKDCRFEPAHFDAIGLIYAHFQADQKANYHRILDSYLRPGGTIILEAFSKHHLQYNAANPAAGGPRSEDMLYSEAEIRLDFPNYEIAYLKEEEVDLQEGLYHNGRSAVLRFVGRKK